VPPALVPHVFEKVRRASAYGGGTGLGLAIVRGLARANGGDAWVRAERRARCLVRLPASHSRLATLDKAPSLPHRCHVPCHPARTFPGQRRASGVFCRDKRYGLDRALQTRTSWRAARSLERARTRPRGNAGPTRQTLPWTHSNDRADWTTRLHYTNCRATSAGAARRRTRPGTSSPTMPIPPAPSSASTARRTASSRSGRSASSEPERSDSRTSTCTAPSRFDSLPTSSTSATTSASLAQVPAWPPPSATRGRRMARTACRTCRDPRRPQRQERSSEGADPASGTAGQPGAAVTLTRRTRQTGP
jgi:hypothetical protein